MKNYMNETLFNDIIKTAQDAGASIKEAIYYTVPTEDYRNFGDTEIGFQPVFECGTLRLIGVHVLHYFIDENGYESCYEGEILYFPEDMEDYTDPGTVLICEDTNPTALPELPF